MVELVLHFPTMYSLLTPCADKSHSTGQCLWFCLLMQILMFSLWENIQAVKDCILSVYGETQQPQVTKGAGLKCGRVTQRTTITGKFKLVAVISPL